MHGCAVREAEAWCVTYCTACHATWQKRTAMQYGMHSTLLPRGTACREACEAEACHTREGDAMQVGSIEKCTEVHDCAVHEAEAWCTREGDIVLWQPLHAVHSAAVAGERQEVSRFLTAEGSVEKPNTLTSNRTDY